MSAFINPLPLTPVCGGSVLQTGHLGLTSFHRPAQFQSPRPRAVAVRVVMQRTDFGVDPEHEVEDDLVAFDDNQPRYEDDEPQPRFDDEPQPRFDDEQQPRFQNKQRRYDDEEQQPRFENKQRRYDNEEPPRAELAKLFVGNLAWATNDIKLKVAFEEFGTVLSAKVVTNHATGKSRGFGFVEFRDPSDAETALNEMDGQSLDGRLVRVDRAVRKPPPQRSFGL